MKKLLIISALALLALTLATTAYAAPFGVARTHGNFSSTTEACAGCHWTHSGVAAKLLNAGTDTTTFCNSCHTDNAKTPYNTNTGVNQDYSNTATTADSAAGGFVTTATVVDTSQHILGGTAVPAGTANLTGNFTCGSCHDPHAGATNIENGNRLLRTQPGPAAGGATAFIIDTTSKLTTGYKSGFTAFCGSCHDMLVTGTDTGHTALNNANTGNTNKYRHSTDVLVATGAANIKGTSLSLGFSKDLITGTPLEFGADGITGGTDDKISCITCHRAHGTKAAANVSYGSYTGVKNTAGVGGSVLLRMDKRGVCFNCHGAGVNNVPN